MNGRQPRSFALNAALSAAMGLLVFFAVESAIARRIGLDLFRPMADGLFLPGRAARLAAALVVCFAAGMTAWGDSLRARLRTLLEKNGGCWAVSAVVTALFFAWALRVIVLSYMISDDVTAMKAISRIPTEGLAVATHTFSHILFCALVGFFYHLAPTLPWYFIYHVGIQLIALWIIGRCILVKARRHEWPVLTGCVLHAFLCAGVFLYAFAAITFTIAAAITGSAAVALMLCRTETRSTAGRIASDIGSALLLLLCYLQRVSAGQAVLCFWALAALYQLLLALSYRDSLFKRRLTALAVTVFMSLALVFGVAAYQPAKAEEGYSWAQYCRSLVLDTLLDDLQDEDFAAAGIPVELATLLRGWFFMDERITTERFWAISHAYYTRIEAQEAAEEADTAEAVPAAPQIALLSAGSAEPAPTAGQGPDEIPSSGPLRECLDTILADKQMRVCSFIALALLLGCVGGFFGAGRRYWPELLTALCAMGGAAVLSLYLSVNGHFPARAFFVIIFPAIVMLLLLSLSFPADAGARPGRRSCALALGCVSAAAFLYLCCLGAAYVPHATDTTGREDLFGTQWKMEAYANEHPEQTIISNAYNNSFDPLHPNAYPKNLTSWGAAATITQENRLYADAFFREDVRFLGDNFSSLLFLLQYLTAEYGPVQAEMVAQLSSSIFIVDISLVTPPEAGYTGWYEQNDMTYYFQDGQALTGEQTIDGESYTFAPIGQYAAINAAPGPNGLIYSTDAYSLVTGD